MFNRSREHVMVVLPRTCSVASNMCNCKWTLPPSPTHPTGDVAPSVCVCVQVGMEECGVASGTCASVSEHLQTRPTARQDGWSKWDVCVSESHLSVCAVELDPRALLYLSGSWRCIVTHKESRSARAWYVGSFVSYQVAPSFAVAEVCEDIVAQIQQWRACCVY